MYINKDIEKAPTDIHPKKIWPPGECPLLLGMPSMKTARLVKTPDDTFPAGGCGYTLNRAAVKLFAKVCLPNFLPNNQDSREDLFL